MAPAADPCVLVDVRTSGEHVGEAAVLHASASRAKASCSQALLEAVQSAAEAGTLPHLHAPALLEAADTSVSQRGPEDSADALQWGICEAIRMLQEAGVAAEATRDVPSQTCTVSCGGSEAVSSGGCLIVALLEAGVPAKLVACLGSLSFEAQKDAVRLFVDIQRYALPFGVERALIAYFQGHPTILQCLLEGCADSSIFAHCAQMLRDCTRHSELMAALLRSGAASRLFELAGSQNFEISSEAFATLREILLEQSVGSAPIVSAGLEEFFSYFHTLLRADMDYIVRRQALRLLGEVLLNPAFREAMCAYVAEDRFLRIHMNALRDSARAIHLGGFHIFKIFVANPRKPHNVRSILHRNRSRLVKLLLSLSVDCKGDDNLREDFSTVIGLLEDLEAPPMKKLIA